jgi:hypothetical protein
MQVLVSAVIYVLISDGLFLVSAVIYVLITVGMHVLINDVKHFLARAALCVPDKYKYCRARTSPSHIRSPSPSWVP